jgi:hypothetical protein
MSLKATTTVLAITSLFASGIAGAWTTITPIPFDTDGAIKNMSVKAKGFGDPDFGGQAWAMHGKWGTFNATKGRKVTITISNPQSCTTANSVTTCTGPVNGFHPAVTTWKRPQGTYSYTVGTGAGKITKTVALTDAKYVPDHNFTPTQSYISTGKSQNHVQDASSSTNPAIASAFYKSGSALIRPGYDTATTPTEADQVLLEDGTTLIGLPRMLHVKSAWDADKATTVWNKLNSDPNLVIARDGVAGKVILTFIPDQTTSYEFFVGGWNPDDSIKTANPFAQVDVKVEGLASTPL